MSVIRQPAATTVSTGSGQRSGLFTRWAGRERSRPGGAVGTRPTTVRGERFLVEDVDDGDRAVLATSHALYRQPAGDIGDVGGEWHRWGWDAVRRVDWAADRRALTVHPLVAPPTTPTVLRLRRGERLAVFAAERVAASKLLDTWVLLADGRRAQVVGRCRPGAAEPVWIVSLAEGPADARTDELVTDAIARLRRRHGI